MDDRIILPESDEAAKLVTVTGWESRRGGFYGKDERAARYDGSTHRLCKCGVAIPKSGWTSCDSCRTANVRVRYESLEYVAWDGEHPLTTFDNDLWFFEEEDVWQYCEDHDCEPDDLLLVVGKPEYGHEIDPEDWAHDYLGEEATLEETSPEIFHAIEAVNAVIRRLKAEKKPLSWFAGNKRTSITKEHGS